MKNETKDIPVWKKYNLTVNEACAYFQIGICKMRNLIKQNQKAPYLLWNGSHVMIKRKMFEDYIDSIDTI